MIRWLLSFIRFAVVSISKLILLIFCLIMISGILHTQKIKVWFDLDWYLHADYRHLLGFSETHQPDFIARLKSKTVPFSDDIYIRDLTSFEWDTVCFLAGYEPYREDMASTRYINKDFPVLEYYGQVVESNHALVFVSGDKVVAVFEDIGIWTVNLPYEYCAGVDTAHFTPISASAYSQLLKDKSPYQVIDRDALNNLRGCSNGDCMLVFKAN